ncbi:MAG TPA: response regulator transcription factor [Chloroflexia bacterium]|nr:response regulator transcription factor [Chloroflexia bacterium]
MSQLQVNETDTPRISRARRILIIEDEPNIADYVSIYCKAEGYDVVHEIDGLKGLSRFMAEKPDFVLLDLMLPGLDGVEVCRRIRAVSDVPIIMVTARTEEVDKLLGLEIGADDYVTKPFSPRELMARIRVIFRRLEKHTTPITSETQTLPDSIFSIGRLTINRDSREVNYAGEPVPTLTNKEYELLLTLARQPGRVYNKTELEEALYDCDSLVASRAIGVHISNLRAKLPNPKLIETVHGVGYKLGKEAL